MQVLVLSDLLTYSRRMDRTRWLFWRTFMQHCDVQFLWPEQQDYTLGMSWRDALRLRYGDGQPDVIIQDVLNGDRPPFLTDMHNCPILKVLWTSDTYPQRVSLEYNRRVATEGRYDAMFSTYPQDFEAIVPYTHADLAWFWTPEAVDTTIYRDWALPRTCDVLIYGATHPGLYPLRHRLACLLPTMPGLDVRVISHPGYGEDGQLSTAVLREESLSHVINQAWLSVATGATPYQDLLLAKYLEIAASKAVVLGEFHAHTRDLFDGCGVNVTMDMSDQAIKDVVRRAVQDRQALASMAAMGMFRVHSQHSITERVKQVLGILRLLLRESRQTAVALSHAHARTRSSIYLG